MKKIILSIDGMTCSACSNGLEKYLNKQKGVVNASVNLVLANALIEYNEKLLTQEMLEKFITEAGFKSLGVFKEIKLDNTNKKNKILFIIFTILAILLFYISMGPMIKLPVPSILRFSINPVSYSITLFSFAILFLIYGFDILKNGYKNLIHFTPNMDTLVSIGVLSSFLYSLYNMYQIIVGNSPATRILYFESTAMVIYFIKLGRYIDGASKNKTRQAIQKLVEITPKNATIKINGIEQKVTIDEIHKGDILTCKPGEKIAVDGKITVGSAHFDEAFITGESKPVNKQVGDAVVAGSVNFDGYIEYSAERIGKESTISEIVQLVVEATNTKPPISKIADTVSSYFVPFVLLVAFFTFIFYLIFGYGFGNALITFVTILVVACPCSLGLATPLAIVISEGKCATNGIIIKKSEILENAKKINTVVFDKTGTLTYGKLQIAKIFNYTNEDNSKIINLVASLEVLSSHPIGLAFADYIEKNNLKPYLVNNFENIPGHGISGLIGDDKYLIGNSKLLAKFNIENSHINDEQELSNLR